MILECVIVVITLLNHVCVAVIILKKDINLNKTKGAGQKKECLAFNLIKGEK